MAEYGITVRWDKNFLKLIRLLLSAAERVRHVRRGALRRHAGPGRRLRAGLRPRGAVLPAPGKPTMLDMPNGLARGVRTASDFLMALQLTGAARRDSLANMQLRLPVVVIGGGLTAIDTATESLAYYVVQVEKFLARYEPLAADAASRDPRPPGRRRSARSPTIPGACAGDPRASAHGGGAKAARPAHCRAAAAPGAASPSSIATA